MAHGVGVRLDCGGSGGGFPVGVPFVVGPETYEGGHWRNILGVPTHPGAFESAGSVMLFL